MRLSAPTEVSLRAVRVLVAVVEEAVSVVAAEGPPAADRVLIGLLLAGEEVREALS